MDGKEYLRIDTASFFVPLEWDPSSAMFLAVAAPLGGLGNFPALVKGDPGDAAAFDSAVTTTVLEFDDATPDSASVETLSPGVYKLHHTLRKGPPGDTGTATLNMSSYGTPAAGDILQVNSGEDDFEYTSQKCGDRYYPVHIYSTPSGNAAYTLATVGIPPQPFDWRPECHGSCLVTNSDYSVAVDLFARINSTSGNIVGRGLGMPGQMGAPHILQPWLAPEVIDSYDKITAGAGATIYFRIERRLGSTATFVTSDTLTTFWVKVNPIP